MTESHFTTANLNDQTQRTAVIGFDGVILLSGGLDSTVMAHLGVSQGKSLRAIYLNFGTYPNLQELDSARHTAHQLGMPMDVVDLPGVPRAVLGYIPLGEVFLGELDIVGETPYMFSSFAVAMAVASYFAQAVQCSELWVGAVGEQISGRKNVPGFFKSWPEVLSLIVDPSAPQLRVQTPFLNGPKSAVVEVGAKLGVAMGGTWSCYRGERKQDGVCGGCRSRRKAFTDADVDDPTEYSHSMEIT